MNSNVFLWIKILYLYSAIVGVLGLIYIYFVGISQEVFAAGVYLVFALIMFVMSLGNSNEVYTAMMILNGILIMFQTAITIILFCASKYPNKNYQTIITLDYPTTENFAFLIFIIGSTTICFEVSGFILLQKAINQVDEEKRTEIRNSTNKSVKNS